jgi:hypothetical protein
MPLTVLPSLFCKLNKALVMMLPFREAVQKSLRNGAKVTGIFFSLFFFLFKELLCLQEREN